MPLLDILKRSKMSIILKIVFVFIKTKKKTNSLLALTTLCKVFGKNLISKVMLTNYRFRFINTINKYFPTINFLLYR